jgi:hypothetical protein
MAHWTMSRHRSAHQPSEDPNVTTIAVVVVVALVVVIGLVLIIHGLMS